MARNGRQRGGGESPFKRSQKGKDGDSLYKEVTERIVWELEQGRMPWVQPWGAAKAALGLPRNAATGRAYSGPKGLGSWVATTA